MTVLGSHQNLRAAGSGLHRPARGITGRPTFHGRVGVRAVGKNHIHVLQLQPLQGSFQSWEKNGGGVGVESAAFASRPSPVWLREKERDEGRLMSHRASGQASVSRRGQDTRHILKGVGTLAIPEDDRRAQMSRDQMDTHALGHSQDLMVCATAGRSGHCTTRGGSSIIYCTKGCWCWTHTSH